MEKKFTLHLPTEQYGFIEEEIVGCETADAVKEYAELKKTALKLDWAKLKEEVKKEVHEKMLKDGEVPF